MNPKQLRDSVENEMAKGVDLVISGKSDSFKSQCVCPSMVSDYLTQRGWIAGELDTNGWQYDWWIHFTHPTNPITVTANGCGYYGTFELGLTEE